MRSRWAFGLAVLLMVLKTATWIALLAHRTSRALNAAYLVTLALMLWSFVLSVSVQPRARRPLDTRVRDPTLVSAAAFDPENDPNARYCERCDAWKPRFVHHCSVCGRCVYRMDHHCPWTSNCVGWNNKKYFLLFLLYTSACTLLFNSMLWAPLWGSDAPAVQTTATSWLQLGWLLSIVVGSVLAGYFCFHLWLLRRGQTTLEFLTSQRGELAKRSLWYNLHVYCGRNVWSWWLPVPPALDATMGGEDEDFEVRRQLVV